MRVPRALPDDLNAAIVASTELDIQGIVAKLQGDKHRSGQRSRGWMTITHHTTQEVVVAGW